MSFDDYLPQLFRLTDDELDSLVRSTGPLRHHGRVPTLHDSEVLTMAPAGESLGIDTDKHIYAFFRPYHRRAFPSPGRVHRTMFVRRSAAGRRGVGRGAVAARLVPAARLPVRPG